MDITQLITNCRSASSFDDYLVDNEIRNRAEEEIHRLRAADPVLCSFIF